MSHSPTQLLSDILDEVEGLRRTDPLSHLPVRLLSAIKEVLAEPGRSAVGGALGPMMLDGLVGETIEQVFESGLVRGAALILCSSGAFVVLDIEGDSDDGYLTAIQGRGGLDAYLQPTMLVSLGLMTREQQVEADKKERIQKAEQRAGRARSELKRAEEELARLNGVQQPIEQQTGAPA